MVLLSFAIALLRSLRACFRSQREQALVELALRQQLAVLARAKRRPRLAPLDRAFWVLLHQVWPRWREVLVVVQPATVVRWHRKGFRLYWRLRSRRRPGWPRIPQELRQLIRRMALENPWGARKIHAELAKLGIEVSLATVSRYLPKRPLDPVRRQNWLTFLRNHKDGIAAMDFFVVPTVSFQLLYVWFTMDHGRRRLIHFNVTTSPTARWAIQQLREAFPSDNALLSVLKIRSAPLGFRFRPPKASPGPRTSPSLCWAPDHASRRRGPRVSPLPCRPSLALHGHSPEPAGETTRPPR
jgi:hypothetical protein